MVKARKRGMMDAGLEKMIKFCEDCEKEINEYYKWMEEQFGVVIEHWSQEDEEV